MNCKPGDLAAKVRLYRDDDVIPVGAVVRCIAYEERPHWKTRELFAGWRVEYAGAERDVDGHFWVCCDGCLRPLRDNDGQDETLTWAGLPNKQEQPA